MGDCVFPVLLVGGFDFDVDVSHPQYVVEATILVRGGAGDRGAELKPGITQSSSLLSGYHHPNGWM